MRCMNAAALLCAGFGALETAEGSEAQRVRIEGCVQIDRSSLQAAQSGGIYVAHSPDPSVQDLVN